MIHLLFIYFNELSKYFTDVKDDQNTSPLDLALKSDNVEVAHFLMSHGGEASKYYVKLLCVACEEGKLDVVKELVEKYNVNPNSESLLCFLLCKCC